MPEVIDLKTETLKCVLDCDSEIKSLSFFRSTSPKQPFWVVKLNKLKEGDVLFPYLAFYSEGKCTIVDCL